MIKIKLLIYCLVVPFVLQAQQKEVLSDPDLIKHQMRIGISKFVNSAFPSDKNAFDLEYRYKYSQKQAFRAGLIYDEDTSDAGFLQLGIKLGIDKQLRNYGNWIFYYGLDFMGNYTNFKSTDKDVYGIAAGPFFGIQYSISKNFSFSVEPMLYYRQNIIVDNTSFNPDNTTKWAESGVGKLGYIHLNFHF